MVFPGRYALSINSCDYLEDIYVKQNSAHTKPEIMRKVWSQFAPNNILNQDSDHPDFGSKRKVLASSFFKSKLVALTQCVKEITLKEIKILQDENLPVIDVYQFILDLQTNIIINASVGQLASHRLVDFEKEDGSIEKISIANAITRALGWIIRRLSIPINVFFPYFLRNPILPRDRRESRNAQHLRRII